MLVADALREPFANPRDERLAEFAKRGAFGLIPDAVNEENTALVRLRIHNHLQPRFVSMLSTSTAFAQYDSIARERNPEGRGSRVKGRASKRPSTATFDLDLRRLTLDPRPLECSLATS